MTHDPLAGAGMTSFMMQNTIVNAASKFIQSGIWWVDATLLIALMSFVGSLMQSFPEWITDIKYLVYKRFKALKNRFIKTYEIELTDSVCINSKTGYQWRPEYRNSTHLVKAVTFYLNTQEQITKIKVGMEDDGEGENEYETLMTTPFQYNSGDGTVYLDNGITVFYQTENKTLTSTSDIQIKNTQITLSCSISHEYLKKFLETVYREYVEKYYRRYNCGKQLHFYTLDAGRSLLLAAPNDAKEKLQLSNWRRYRLNVSRTFESLFFDQKESVLSLVDNFLQKKGMYALDSIPYKLSFLLYGPPGTGKTSFIKALANLTKRSIVNISLPLIETNGQLLDIFQCKNLTCHDYTGQRTDKVPLEKRIYILEDIDALSQIVQSRREKKSKVNKKSKSESTTNVPIVGQTTPLPLTDASGQTFKNQFERYILQSDELNLSGLLNVLDGLMELTGAIIVLTTNYPDRLDEALIRPGRITKRLLMGNMSETSVKQMVEYYFHEKPSLDISGIQVSPAQMENMCLSATTVTDLEKELSEHMTTQNSQPSVVLADQPPSSD